MTTEPDVYTIKNELKSDQIKLQRIESESRIIIFLLITDVKVLIFN